MARHRRKPSEGKRPLNPMETSRHDRVAQLRATEQNLRVITVLRGGLDAARLPLGAAAAYSSWQEEHLADCIYDGVVAATERRQLRQPNWLSVPQDFDVLSQVLQHSGEAALSLAEIARPAMIHNPSTGIINT